MSPRHGSWSVGARRFDTERLTRIGDWMNGYVKSDLLAGSSLAISQGADAVYYNDCGQSDVETNAPFQRDAILRIFSMTKPVTSLALMMLIERGLVHLDAQVSDFLPDFGDTHALVSGATRIDQTAPCQAPTLHQLLTHTSGFSYPFNAGVLPALMHDKQLLFKPEQGLLSDMVADLATLPLAFEPGTRWEYSVSIDVIGRVIEVVTGGSLAEFFRREIFEPLGMDQIGFTVPDAALPRFASLYTPLAGDIFALNTGELGPDPLRLVENSQNTVYRNARMQSGGGGLVSTIDDYLRFANMLRDGGSSNGHRIVSPGTVDFMMQNHLPGDIASMGPSSFAEQPMEGMGFGLGGAVVLNPARARCPGSIGDFSWGGMASTFFWIDPVHDMSVVFFTQLAPSNAYPLRSQLKALVHAALT